VNSSPLVPIARDSDIARPPPPIARPLNPEGLLSKRHGIMRHPGALWCLLKANVNFICCFEQSDARVT
jgi:hypothetical protein